MLYLFALQLCIFTYFIGTIAHLIITVLTDSKTK